MSNTLDLACRNGDVVYFFLLNMASAFMLSAAHNVLFFVLDIRTPVIHFLHYFFTFLFMILLYALGCIPKNSLGLQEFKVPVGVKFIETILSSIVHAQNRTGGLYLVRVFDFMFTLTVVIVGHIFVPLKKSVKPESYLIIPLALATSLAWLEYGQMEYTPLTLFCAPILAIFRALSLLTTQRAHHRCNRGHLEQFCLYYSGLVSCALFLPAVISYFFTHVEVTASWESIDYVLMGLSFLFMSCNLYSELWLTLSVNMRAYATLDHTKYLGASVGQWIIQNMAHPNIIALGGKVVAVACLFRIWASL